MLFNSFQYLVFFPVFCLIYFTLKTTRAKLWLTFFASCYFYGFFIPKYLLILFLVIGIDFFAGLKIESATEPKQKKLFLGLSLAANLSILIFFKYVNFFITNVMDVGHTMGWNLPLHVLEIVLPIGLSFHTFQSMAYVIEVYYGRAKAERDLLTYSIYVLYFPQLVAGPIERPQHLLPQFRALPSFDYERAVSGLYLIAQGLMKKCVVADSLAPLANVVFDSPEKFGFLGTVFGVLAFTIQIYGDFSGYSDIARGSSRILGVELMVNFDKPYFATSISDFWRRWHISLSTWFRDYLYIPLGGNKTGPTRNYFNLMSVFMVSGLWHGANWTFVVWGTLHGIYLIAEKKIVILQKLNVPLKRIYVFVLVALAWIFFRAKDIVTALEVYGGFFRYFGMGMDLIKPFLIQEMFLASIALIFFEWLDEKKTFWTNVRTWRPLQRWVFYWSIVLLFLFSARFSANQFIYFQF